MGARILHKRELLVFSVLLIASGCVEPAPSGRTAETASRAETGYVDRNALDALASEIRQGRFGNTHALLVARNGHVAYDAYFTGDDRIWGEDWVRDVAFGPDRLHDARSITKTVVSSLVGIALEQGHISSIDAPLHELLPSHRHLLTGSKRALTLRHLLTMTDGLAWNEETPGPENDETRMYASVEPVSFILQRELAAEPGQRWAYSGATTQLLAAVLEARTGRPIEDYLTEVLFEPLGIVQFEWRGVAAGMPAAASGLRLLPRDFAKLGIMFADGGRWNGRQVVPEFWLREAMRSHVEIPAAPDPPSWVLRSGYGFQWWYDEYAQGGQTMRVSTASGLGGQRIFVVPQHDLVVVVLSGHFGNPAATWIPENILRRVVEAQPDPR